ncbi:hypothetical protein TREMEDRAFT_72833 [Tremella mesenterica DSM 1558]|uniref:uncharacterized protein n=1 Tax=Tremella mesenterica (strain ATCC 24925 / CBS 8224 / DSM 1558 / NBRC 9311 / NRRL Y-6157 / RJB 2259-6 / UBC 559-6) TaxID=578456 RepID=UPI0003F4A426|nr:uncharacterized protein TREMEDRAFT_72833 [Tremella mesenterica DSM 1558]EIW72643.1 hypothetical protein TREMEDRAFT_72833 [Tremella mesenterica DSM 1558]
MLLEERSNALSLPSSTPVASVYPNLVGSTQHARNNFRPAKRKWKRVPSAQENEFALRKILQEYWGYDSFRGPQLDICLHVMGGCDVLVVAPTGLGKSICFQVPAIAMEHGVTLVVSPLIALMEDQLQGLRKRGIKAAVLCEKTPKDEEAEIKRQLTMGHPELRLLYLTPESLFSKRHEYHLRRAYEQKQLVRLVVDEAHVLDVSLPPIRPIPDPISRYTSHGPYGFRNARRPRKHHFYLEAVETPFGSVGGTLQQKEPVLRADFISSHRAEAMQRNREKGVTLPCASGLVYCRSRIACEDVVRTLVKKGITARPFHALLPEDVKRRTLLDWQEGKVECIVATIAFGMGIDAPHVRYVVHWDMPKSFEGFYQETGRAGRDGHASRCILYYCIAQGTAREDAYTLRGLIEREANLAKSRRDAGEGEGSERDADKIRQLNSFKRLQQYAESFHTCRHINICRYFGEQMDDRDPEVRKAYCSGMCDVCSNAAVVMTRACTVSEEVPLASQVVPLPPRQRPETIVEVEPASDDMADSTLVQIHRLTEALISPAEATFPEDDSRPVPPVGITGLRIPSLDIELDTGGPSPPASSRLVHGKKRKSKDSHSLFLHQSDSPSGSMVDPGVRIFSHVSRESASSFPSSPSPISPPAQISSPKKSSISTSASPPLPEQPQKSPVKAKNLKLKNRPNPPPEAPVPPLSDIQLNHAQAYSDQCDTPCRILTGNIHCLPIVGPDEGTYATLDTPPPEKSKKQAEEFRKIKPVTGKGLFPMYDVSTPMTRRRAPALHPTFKVPFARPPSVQRVGPILMENRDTTRESIKQALLFTFKQTLRGRELWDFWDRKESGKERLIALDRIARLLETELAHTSLTGTTYDKNAEALCGAIRILSQSEVADSILGGKLGKSFKGSSQVKWIRMVEARVKGEEI